MALSEREEEILKIVIDEKEKEIQRLKEFDQMWIDCTNIMNSTYSKEQKKQIKYQIKETFFKKWG